MFGSSNNKPKSPEKRVEGAKSNVNLLENLLPVEISTWSGKEQDMAKLILYQDKHIIACYKPSTYLSQPVRLNNKVDEADNSMEILLTKYLQAQNQNKFDTDGLHMLQRIDRPCSGILLFATSDLARRSLSEQFQKHSVDKRYLCVVNGDVTESQRCTDYLLKSNASISKVISSVDSPSTNGSLSQRKDCVEASLSFRPIKSISFIKSSNKADSLNPVVTKQTVLEVKLDSGRKHQIRAQLSHQKLPIVGDIKYGAPQRFSTQDIALHAYYIRFRHPVTKKTMSIQIGPPRIWNDRFKLDFSNIIDSLKVLPPKQ
jgi:23S rRNA pseudouridine1911/1915/1917 synthase